MSDETKIFRLGVHGLHGDNTRIDVCLEGVIQTTMNKIVNRSICEGMYAWEIEDAFNHYADNTQERLALSWNVLLSPFATEIEKRKSLAHAYTVELRFLGEQLEPSEISARLNLQPSHAFSQSLNQSSKKKRCPYWGYDGQGEEGYQSEWTDGLEFLFKILISRKAEIIALARQFDGLLWCGHFQTSFDGGPTLSPKLLTEISSYGISLSIDNYFFDIP